MLLQPGTIASLGDWLSEAIILGPAIGGLRPHVPPAAETTYGDLVLKFVAGKSPETPFDERLRLLKEVARTEHPLAVPARRHVVYALRTACRWEEALTAVDELIAAVPSNLHRRQKSGTLSLARRFRDSLIESEGYPEHTGIRRRADFAHGRINDNYLQVIADEAGALRNRGHEREYLEEAGVVLVRRVLLADDCSLDEIAAFQAECEIVGHTVGLRDSLLASVLHPGTDPGTVQTSLERLAALDALATGDIGYRYALGTLWRAYIHEDRELAASLADQIEALAIPRGRSWIPAECLLWTMGSPLRTEAPTQWLEPVEVVLARWRTIFETAKNRYVG